jgi:hypothetical protein
MLLATGGIHLDLYLTGYRFIPTIGVLFIFQVVGAISLGLAVIAVPRRIVAISGALFALSTLSGYVFSVWAFSGSKRCERRQASSPALSRSGRSSC